MIVLVGLISGSGTSSFVLSETKNESMNRRKMNPFSFQLRETALLHDTFFIFGEARVTNDSFVVIKTEMSLVCNMIPFCSLGVLSLIHI